LGNQEITAPSFTVIVGEEDAGTMENLQLIMSNLVDQLYEEPEQEQARAVQELLTAQLRKLYASMETATAFFQQSMDLYRLVLQASEDDEERSTWRYLASIIYNLGNIYSQKGDMEQAENYLTEALEIQQTNMEYLTQTTTTVDNNNKHQDNNVAAALSDVKESIGETWYSLANVYVQQGKYDKADSSYKSAMLWYQQHNLSPHKQKQQQETVLPTDTINTDNDAIAESIQQYEAMLEEYQELFSRDGADLNIDHGDGVYQRDEGYEADLHNALGAMYMSTGDFTMAQVHVDQAISLYSIQGEGQETYFADVLYNQALLLFQQGEFLKSLEAYHEALELYRQLLGEGVKNDFFGTDTDIQSLVEEAQREAHEHAQKLQILKKEQGGGMNTLKSNNDKKRSEDATTKTKEIQVGDHGAIKADIGTLTISEPEQAMNETEMMNERIIPLQIHHHQ
jgi:tetratricopeptide (TPR) repeat protein